MKDLASSTAPALSLAPATRTSTANGATIDLRGYHSALALVAFGTYTDGTHTPKLQESDDGTNWNDVDAGNLSTAFTDASSAANASSVQKVGYTGLARYLRLVLSVSGATDGAASAGLILRGHAAQQPA